MQIGMRQISSETVEWFGTACKGGDLTRTALACELCGVRVKGLASRVLRLATACVADDWLAAYGAHLPAIFPGRAEQAAAYRLLSNEAVTMEHILDSHFEQTVARRPGAPPQVGLSRGGRTTKVHLGIDGNEMVKTVFLTSG